MMPDPISRPTQVNLPTFPGADSVLMAGMKLFALILFLGLVLVSVWPIFPFVLGIVIMILIRRGETQRRINCWTLAIAVEKQIPLDRTIASLAAESGAWMRLRLWRLFSYVTAGARFEDAISGVRRVVPHFALPLLRIGCLSGRPARAMQIICSEEDNENYKMSQTLLGRFFYLFIAFNFSFAVIVFLLIKIVPAYQKIFEDFGMSLPPISVFFIHLSYFVYTYWYLFVPPMFFLFLFGIYVLLRLLGVFPYDLPGMAWFTRKLHRARVQDSLALAAECDMPIINALRELTLFYPTYRIRERLARAYMRVESGWDWKQELRAVGLLSQTEYAVVQSAESLGDLPWTLRLLAQKGRRRMLYWAQWLQQLLFFAAALSFGMFIALVSLAMFLPLVKLITSLS